MSDFDDKNIMKVFEKPALPVTSKKVGLWQVHPVEKGVRLFSETH